MNKFLAILLVAASASMVVCAPTNEVFDDEPSELSLNPENDEETRYLEPRLKPFSDFCWRSRDHVVGDILNQSNTFASSLFSYIFRSVGDVGKEAIEANKEGTKKLANQILHPESEISESGDDAASKIIEEGQQKIKAAGSQPLGLFNAIVSGISNLGVSAYDAAVKKLKEGQEKMGALSLTENLVVFCDSLDKYRSEIEKQFEEFKAEIVESEKDLADVNFRTVASQCVTSNRVVNVEGMCKLVMAGKRPFLNLINKPHLDFSSTKETSN